METLKQIHMYKIQNIQHMRNPQMLNPNLISYQKQVYDRCA